MYDKYINQLANVLMLNCQKVSGQGLLNGTLGIAMFFYHYSHFVDDKRYADFADGILSDTINVELNKETWSFANGYLGIGWCMKYLSKYHFVKLQSDSLAEIEDMLTKKQRDDIGLELSKSNSVFATGLFAIGMDDGVVSKVLHELYSLLLKPMPISLCYLNSVIYFLDRLSKNLSKSVMAKKIVCRVKELLDKYDFEANAPYRDIYIFNNLCWRFGVEKMQAKKPKDVLDDVYMNWQTITYSCMPSASDVLPIELLEQYLERITCDVPYGKLSLDGLASLGINLIVRNRMYNN